MRRERVSDDIYIFTSELYAQVIASAILTDEGAIVIDSLPYPVESREMAAFVQRRHPRGARYIINTHFHADHIYGNGLFPEAQIIGHARCREAIQRIDRRKFEQTKLDTPALAGVELRAPTIVFEQEMGLSLGSRSLRLLHLPGHSPDGIGIFVEGDRILFAGDAVMPVPYFGTGDHEVLRATLQRILELSPEHIVQGHGETLLRGEIPETLERHIAYIDCAVEQVTQLLAEGDPIERLQEIPIEACGISAIPLDGLVRQLHHANLVRLYHVLPKP